MQDLPRNAGFSRISTRRTASSAVMASPARMRKGRTSLYFQSAGTQGLAGCGGTSACSTSHSGVRVSGDMSRYSCWRTSPAGSLAWVSGAFMACLLVFRFNKYTYQECKSTQVNPRACARGPLGTLAAMAKSFDFQHAPGPLIRRAHQLAVSIFMEETSDYGVTPVQFAILNALIDTP